MSNQNPYAGKITNSGAQVVKAPFSNKGRKSGTKATTGGDLRTGKK